MSQDILKNIFENLERLENILRKIAKRDFDNINNFLKDIENLQKNYINILKSLENEKAQISISEQEKKLLREKFLKINILSNELEKMINKEIKFFERQARKNQTSFINKKV